MVNFLTCKMSSFLCVAYKNFHLFVYSYIVLFFRLLASLLKVVPVSRDAERRVVGSTRNWRVTLRR